MNNNSNIDPRIFSKMNSGDPVSSYKKTVPSVVEISILSPFSDTPEAILLTGDPKKDESASIDTWSEKQDLYLRNVNRRLFELGYIIRYEKKAKEEVKSIEQSTDEELIDILNKTYASLSKELNKISTLAVLVRLLDLAKENEKSDKVVRLLESRISELQLKGIG